MISKLFAATLALTAMLTSQQVVVRNHSGDKVSGWVRATTPKKSLTGETGVCPKTGFKWVAGRDVGVDLRVVDILTDNLSVGDTIVELSKPEATQVNWELPVNSLPVINGKVMSAFAIQADGAAVTAEFRARIGDFIYFLYARHSGGERWILGELLVLNSNQNSTSMVSTFEKVQLTWGDMLVTIHGEPEDRNLCDGQARAMIVGAIELDGMTMQEAHSYKALFEQTIWARGQDVRWQGQTSSEEWTRYVESQWTKAWDGMSNWDAAPAAPSPRSGDTGKQGDQMLQLGCDQTPVGYFTNVKIHALRPANFCENNGEPYSKERHPNCWLWDGRPHFGLSSDRLGKERPLHGSETHGYQGPDSQHWLIQGLVAAYRQTASPMAQRLLRNHAALYLGTRTSTPGWSTSVVHAARETGYEGINAVHLWRNIEDRKVAHDVRQRYTEWANNILIPYMKDRDVLFIFDSDPRLGSGQWCIAWQESLGSWGTLVAYNEFQIEGLQHVATRVAENVVQNGWLLEGGQWKTRAQFALDDPARQRADQSFNDFGMPMAVDVLRQRWPNHQKSRAIADYLDSFAFQWWP